MTLEEATAEKVVARLPFAEHNVTLGDQVHGGAIAALIDSVATAAAWAGADPESPPKRGTTVHLDVSYTHAARSCDLLAVGTVKRRGRSICFCNVDVYDEENRLVATGAAVYKLGS